MESLKLSDKTRELLQQYHEYTIGGFCPLPAFMDRAEGTKLWDVDGKEYLDFTAMYSAVNQGHQHPKIVEAVRAQLDKAALLNLAVQHSAWAPFAKELCQRFGYDRVAAMTSGAEAADTACKLARRWGINVKGIPAEKCLVLGVSDNYHGVTSGVWNLMNPSGERKGYGLDNLLQRNTNPTTGRPLEYGNIAAMEECLNQHHSNVAAVIIECIHGHLPTFEEEIKYARQLYDLCKKHNILFIADEVRMGVAKTGKFFSYQHLGSDVRPDIITMGKSITGGVYPASYILANNDVAGTVGTFEIASTFAATPLGITATRAALKVVDDEHLIEKAQAIEKQFMAETATWGSLPYFSYATARGGDMNIIFKPNSPYRKVCAIAMHRGVLTSNAKDRVRLSISLFMTKEELAKGMAIIKSAFEDADKYAEVEGEVWTGR